MQKLSAGLLMYRFKNDKLEVFLVHPGGRIGRAGLKRIHRRLDRLRIQNTRTFPATIASVSL